MHIRWSKYFSVAKCMYSASLGVVLRTLEEMVLIIRWNSTQIFCSYGRNTFLSQVYAWRETLHSTVFGNNIYMYCLNYLSTQCDFFSGIPIDEWHWRYCLLLRYVRRSLWLQRCHHTGVLWASRLRDIIEQVPCDHLALEISDRCSIIWLQGYYPTGVPWSSGFRDVNW